MKSFSLRTFYQGNDVSKMMVEFLALVPSQKHQFEQISVQENTYTRVKDSR